MPFWSREHDKDPEDSPGDSASDDLRDTSQGDLDGDADNSSSASESESAGSERWEELGTGASGSAGEQSGGQGDEQSRDDSQSGYSASAEPFEADERAGHRPEADYDEGRAVDDPPSVPAPAGESGWRVIEDAQSSELGDAQQIPEEPPLPAEGAEGNGYTEGPSDNSGDAQAFPTTSEYERADAPYAAVSDSSVSENGGPGADRAESEVDISAAQRPSAPDDRIRDLFRRRQESADGTASDEAPTSVIEAPERIAEPELPQPDPEPVEDVEPLEQPRGRFSRLLPRRKVKEDSEIEDSVSTEPGTGRRSKPVAPELLPWEPRGNGFKFKQRLKSRQVSISVDADTVRVVVSKGQEILAWGSVLVADAPQVDEETGDPWEVRLKALLADLGARRGRVITDIPFNAPLMRHLELPKMRRRYVESVVMSEMEDTVPFSLDQVDLVWQSRSNGADHDIMAVATSSEAVDAHMSELARAGVRAKAMFPKATAWAHASGVSDGIIVNIGRTRAAFVLVSRWVPVVVYEAHFGDPDATDEQKAEQVSRAVEEVAGYAQGLDSGDRQPLHVLLTGDLADDAPLADEIRRALRREVLTMAPPLIYPQEFRPSEYATNVGLILAEQVWRKTRGKTTVYEAPALNLLPPRHQPRPIPTKQAAVFAGLLLLGAVAFSVGDRVDAVSNEQATLSGRLTELRGEERTSRLLGSRAQATEAQIGAAIALTESLEADLSAFDGELDTSLERLDVLSRGAMPAGVKVAGFGAQEDGYGFGGTAPAVEDAIQYMKNLRESGLYGTAQLHQVSIADDREASVVLEDGEVANSVSFQASAQFVEAESEEE